MDKLILGTLIIFLTTASAISGASVAVKQKNKEIEAIKANPTLLNMPDMKGGNMALTMDEVSKHTKPNDCWLVIDSKVYDVSSYLNLHPGGVGAITANCGREVTGLFASIHSNWAWDLLSKYKLGDLGGTAMPQKLISGVTNTNGNADFNALQEVLGSKYPNAEIIKIKPKKGGVYEAKLVYDNILYEVRFTADGQILKEEVENDKYDWSFLKAFDFDDFFEEEDDD